MRQQLLLMEQGLAENYPELLHNPFIVELLHNPEIREMVYSGAPSQALRKHFSEIMLMFSPEHRDRLRAAGIINQKNEPTPAGLSLLRSIGRRRG
jgi:hypothetical protein